MTPLKPNSIFRLMPSLADIVFAMSLMSRLGGGFRPGSTSWVSGYSPYFLALLRPAPPNRTGSDWTTSTLGSGINAPLASLRSIGHNVLTATYSLESPVRK
jgi:hypothetical protein